MNTPHTDTIEERVEMFEIWQAVEEGGEAILNETGKHLKRVAIIVNGIPIKLEDGWFVERRSLSKEEAESLTSKKD